MFVIRMNEYSHYAFDDINAMSLLSREPEAPVMGGWRKGRAPANEKRITHPLPSTPRSPRRRAR
jgi:hypothetical protein